MNVVLRSLGKEGHEFRIEIVVLHSEVVSRQYPILLAMLQTSRSLGSSVIGGYVM